MGFLTIALDVSAAEVLHLVILGGLGGDAVGFGAWETKGLDPRAASW